MAAWFRPKRYGLGLTPSSWQGWALTAAYVVLVTVLGLTVAATQIWIFLALFAVATTVFVLVAYLTRE
jgi:hypothetical protein